MRKLALAGAIALAITPAVANLASGTPAHPQGGTKSAACGTGDNSDGTIVWSPTNLWPPNHKPRNITISYHESSPEGGDHTHSFTIGTIAEYPASTNGAGNTNADSTGSGYESPETADNVDSTNAKGSVTLLAERSGHDMAGRTYAIPVTCQNDGDDDQTITICITTPHDQSAKHAVVEDTAAACAAETVLP